MSTVAEKRMNKTERSLTENPSFFPLLVIQRTQILTSVMVVADVVVVFEVAILATHTHIHTGASLLSAYTLSILYRTHEHRKRCLLMDVKAFFFKKNIIIALIYDI